MLFRKDFEPNSSTCQCEDIQNGVSVEIARARKAEGNKRRAGAVQGKKDL